MATILSPDDPRAPRYWMHEQSGVLTPVVLAYLHGEELSAGDVYVMRMYLRQWILSPVWRGGEELRALRESVETIQSREDLSKWLRAAVREGHDPL